MSMFRSNAARTGSPGKRMIAVKQTMFRTDWLRVRWSTTYKAAMRMFPVR